MITAKAVLAISAILLSFPVAAQELDPIDPAAIAKLKAAYQANGGSMNGWGSIDMSGKTPLADNAITCADFDSATKQLFWECQETVRTGLGKTESTATVPPAPLSADLPVVKRRRHAEANICSIHGMRKVFHNEGKSWRCRK